MHYAEPSPIDRNAAHQRTLLVAWSTLLVFFTLFLGLLAWASLELEKFYQEATISRGGTLIVRGSADGITWRPADRTLYQAAGDGQALTEGDTVRAATSAGYGQVASIQLFEQSQLDLWAGTEVSLETLHISRWHSSMLQMVMRQSSGYVRYDLKSGQPYAVVDVAVRVGDTLVQLAPGGSYSIELRKPERLITRIDSGNSFEADVAVRSGSVKVLGTNGTTVELREHEHVLIDAAGIAGLPVPARWDLVRDGGFSQYTVVEYNNTTLNDLTSSQSRYWKVYSGPDLPAQNRGFFGLDSICRPPSTERSCELDERRTAASFARLGGQTSSFMVGVKQEFGSNSAGVDISEYRSLQFTLWARVLYQSLSDAGDRGSECPVMIRLVAKRNSPADPEEQRDVCIFVDADQIPPTVERKDPGIAYYQAALAAKWTKISFNLRDEGWLPDYRYLRGIQIFAQGHDYDSRVTEVSLVGEQ